jgi:hypothetical protein
MWDEQQIERESWRIQVAENSARLAFAWGVSTTTGSGGLVHDQDVQFGLAYPEQPMFSYGCVIISTEIDLNDDDAPVPSSTGFVAGWQIDERGLYVGANVGVTVIAQAEDVLEHHFTFTGIGMKDLDIKV